MYVSKIPKKQVQAVSCAKIIPKATGQASIISAIGGNFDSLRKTDVSFKRRLQGRLT